MEAATVDPILRPGADALEILTPVRIWTDGSCPENPGCGGWAIVAERDGRPTHVRGGGVAQTTNNIMELTAVREAMHLGNHLEERVQIISDSQYVVKGITEWITGWKLRDWTRKTKQGIQPVLNRELWEELDLLYAPEFMEMVWVKGHDGAEFNELADVLAGQHSAVFRGR